MAKIELAILIGVILAIFGWASLNAAFWGWLIGHNSWALVPYFLSTLGIPAFILAAKIDRDDKDSPHD